MKDNDLWQTLLTCFSLGAAASVFNTLRQPVLPGWRQLVATWFYTGTSAVAISLCLVHFANAQSSPFLYFASLLAGLGSVDVLTAVWSKMIPGLANGLSQKLIGKNVIGDAEAVPVPIPAEKPVQNHDSNEGGGQ